ncbi:DNA damage-regulated autophagy modulator protein 1-like [Clytia hemisphaerica]|uniref:DNA damage-regulated autophagy modulator protein 1-like n=1 Tax=Clytia hemisphaerica TaxID=252671 RepID=UPI0034D4979F|eukprot:TCONS_00017658-protein
MSNHVSRDINQTEPSLIRYRRIIMALPLVTVSISVITVIVAYIVATYEREVENPGRNCTLHTNFPPYISDVGDCKPQSSYFTFGMILSGCVSLLIFIIRYLQVRNFYVDRDCANLASIITAFILITGKFMAISFQLSSHKPIHFFGATGYFFGTFVYCCLQARISYKDHNGLFIFRLICSFGLFITGFLFAVFIIPSVEMRYLEYNVAQVSEWTFAILKMLFMLTFWIDFRDIVPVLDAKHVKEKSYESLDPRSYDNVSIDETLNLNSKPMVYNSTAV